MAWFYLQDCPPLVTKFLEVVQIEGIYKLECTI